MFTLQAQAKNRLAASKTFEEFTSNLDFLFQCNAPLEHRGEVNFTQLNIQGNTTGFYAVAASTWVRVAGHMSWVWCREATDPMGTLTSDATQFLVYLPRTNAAKDPNVYAGDILQYVRLPNGSRVSVGESYLDDPIGTIKGQFHTTLRHGWKKCDGAGGRPQTHETFLRGNTSAAGGTGGTSSHTHTVSVTVASNTTGITAGSTAALITVVDFTGSTSSEDIVFGGTATIGYAVTGITIDDHPDHAHSIEPRFTTIAYTAGASNAFTLSESGGAPIDWESGPEETYPGFADTDLTHTVVEPFSSPNLGHTHTLDDFDPDADPHSHTMNHGHSASSAPHTHTITDPGHAHTGSGSTGSAAHLPPYLDVVWIIREGPAGEIV